MQQFEEVIHKLNLIKPPLNLTQLVRSDWLLFLFESNRIKVVFDGIQGFANDMNITR